MLERENSDTPPSVGWTARACGWAPGDGRIILVNGLLETHSSLWGHRLCTVGLGSSRVLWVVFHFTQSLQEMATNSFIL